MQGVVEVRPERLQTLYANGLELPYVEFGSSAEPGIKLVFQGEEYWYYRTLPIKGYGAVMAKYIRALHGEGKKLFGTLPIHTHCVATHKLFHLEAGKIAEAINANNFVEAESMLAAHTHFSKTSNALAAAILRLKKDAASTPGFISLIAKLSE